MSESAWSWTLFAFEVIGITGMWIVGRRLWWGWLIVLLHSVPWFVYSLISERRGFTAMTLMWWTVNAWNMVRWKRSAVHPG